MQMMPVPVAGAGITRLARTTRRKRHRMYGETGGVRYAARYAKEEVEDGICTGVLPRPYHAPYNLFHFCLKSSDFMSRLRVPNDVGFVAPELREA